MTEQSDRDTHQDHGSDPQILRIGEELELGLSLIYYECRVVAMQVLSGLATPMAEVPGLLPWASQRCARGGIGRRARLRIWCPFRAWGFESLRAHTVWRQSAVLRTAAELHIQRCTCVETHHGRDTPRLDKKRGMVHLGPSLFLFRAVPAVGRCGPFRSDAVSGAGVDAVRPAVRSSRRASPGRDDP